MDRWSSCDSSLTFGEVVVTTVGSIRLYDGDKRTSHDDGSLTLTNQRMLWRHPSQASSLVLPLGLVLLVEEEAGGFTSSPKLVLHLAPPSPALTPSAPSTSAYVKLSFRNGGSSSFHQALQRTLRAQEWEKFGVAAPSGPPTNQPSQGSGKAAHTGILGIERALQAKQEEASQNISRAFEDLKNLMGEARIMVNLSRTIAAKLRDRAGEMSADDATQFRSYLLSLGIDDPVTRDACGSSSQYHQQLGREVCQVLEGPVQEAGGVMLLSEVYCRINRARGLQLLSPEDVMQACQGMRQLGLPLHLHTFQSGVQVLQSSSLDQDQLVQVTAQALDQHQDGGMSAADLARETGIPLLLARERLLLAEQCAQAVRDESSEGLRFYPNLFLTHS